MSELCFVFASAAEKNADKIVGKYLKDIDYDIQYLSSGLPVLGLCGKGDVSNLVIDNEFGRVYDGRDPNEAYKIIKLLEHDIESKKISPEKLKRYVRENLSVKFAVKKILNNLKE